MLLLFVEVFGAVIWVWLEMPCKQAAKLEPSVTSSTWIAQCGLLLKCDHVLALDMVMQWAVMDKLMAALITCVTTQAGVGIDMLIKARSKLKHFITYGTLILVKSIWCLYLHLFKELHYCCLSTRWITAAGPWCCFVTSGELLHFFAFCHVYISRINVIHQ